MAPEGPHLLLLQLRRRHTSPDVPVSEGCGSDPDLLLSQQQQQHQEQQLLLQGKGPFIGPGKPRKRLMSRPELLRHYSHSLLLPSSSSLLLPHGKQEAADLSSLLQGGILLLYITGWSKPYLHHRLGGGPWSAAPGVSLTRVSADTPEGKTLFGLLPQRLRGHAEDKLWYFFASAPTLEFLLNDGGGQWDRSPTDEHYYLGCTGSYVLFAGSLERLSEPPQKPAVLRCTKSGSSEVSLAWNPSPFKTETVAAYHIYRDSVLVGSVDGCCLHFTDYPPLVSRVFNYFVCAANEEGQESPPSDTLAVQTAEEGKPSAPNNLRCTHKTPSSIEISWDPPTDSGGPPVLYYRVYREGLPFGCLPAVGPHEHTFKDTHVLQGETYQYAVSAWTSIPPEADKQQQKQQHNNGDRSNSSSGSKSSNSGCCRKDGRKSFNVERSSRNSTNTTTKNITGNSNSRSTTSSTSSTNSSRSSSSSKKTEVVGEGLLSASIRVRAEAALEGPRLEDKKPHIMLQGFNWLSAKNPFSWYKILFNKLDEICKLGVTIVWCPPPTECVDWEGYMPTKWYSLKSHYGSEAELRTLLAAARRKQLCCCVDVVANHRCATQQDAMGHWTIFEGPPWGPWAVVSNNLQGYRALGSLDTGVSVDCAPDVDHTNPQVQKDLKKWTRWLIEEVGYSGFRIDMAGGYAPQYQKAFVEDLGRPFTVGEYWHGDTLTLLNYVRAGGGAFAAFDFALYYHLQRAVESGDFGILKTQDRINGLIGIEPRLAVTFIENHDTDHLDYCRTFCNGELNGVLQGYAVILTHPGIPCIYWNHFSDYGDYCRQKLQELCDVRTSMGIHSTSGLYIDRAERGLYTACITPKDSSCQPQTARVAVKVGWEEWQPQGEGWKVATCGHNFCVWTR